MRRLARRPWWCVPSFATAALVVTLHVILFVALGPRAASGTTTGGDARTSADVTEEWRGFARVFERVFADPVASAAASGEPRTIVLLIEPTSALASTGFLAAWSAALDGSPAWLARTKVGVARVGAPKPLLAPSDDPKAIVAAVRAALEKPDERVLDVYADVREIATSLSARAGERAIFLCALENGDAESDLEATVARVSGVGVRVDVLTSESYVADSYWAERAFQAKPRGTQLTGGDSAWIDVPFGWLFQFTVANEVTPSGFGGYALSRLAAQSGGRVHLYSSPTDSAHRCSVYGICAFCTGDHAPENELYAKARLVPLAPSLASRADVMSAWTDDPVARATAEAWRAALQAGLLRGEPPRTGRETGVDPGAAGRATQFSSPGFDRNVDRARASAKECERILAAFDSDLGRVDAQKGSPRARAVARFTRLMLILTKANLLTYAGWCDEIAPGLFDKTPSKVTPPEVPVINGEARNLQIGFHNVCLCHGAKPFLELELPGGPALREELARLDREITAYLESYANTPYAVAIHRQGLAVFQPTFTPAQADRARPKSKSGPELGPATGGARPPRSSGGSGGSTGPATGGGG